MKSSFEHNGSMPAAGNHAPLPPQPYCNDSVFMTQWKKMLAGEIYEARHAYFHQLLMETRSKIKVFNDMDPSKFDELESLMRTILGRAGKGLYINQPFRCDYGCNIVLGDNVFINFNMTILDEALVSMGSNVFIGPNVSIYTACHPLNPDERRDGREWAEPVTIGNDVWIGGGATLLPGITVGDGAVIGAGAVVSRSFPPRTVVAGNPARVVKQIP